MLTLSSSGRHQTRWIARSTWPAWRSCSSTPLPGWLPSARKERSRKQTGKERGAKGLGLLSRATEACGRHVDNRAPPVRTCGTIGLRLGYGCTTIEAIEFSTFSLQCFSKTRSGFHSVLGNINHGVGVSFCLPWFNYFLEHNETPTPSVRNISAKKWNYICTGHGVASGGTFFMHSLRISFWVRYRAPSVTTPRKKKRTSIKGWGSCSKETRRKEKAQGIESEA